jgi:transcriptional regulator
MYLPPVFREDDPAVLAEVIRRHPLATLITSGPDALIANLAPFLFAEGGERGILRAHIARANDQVEALRGGAETLVVFQGPESYITPSWYASKQEHGRVVPTWNYVMVQVRGTPRLIEDETWIRAQVSALTAQQEGGRPEPWAVSDAPEAYIEGQLKAIVGVEIPISTIEGKWKVSQNRSVADREAVADGLQRAGDTAMAHLVRKKVY